MVFCRQFLASAWVILLLSTAALAQPAERARELMREHRYGRALRVLSTVDSADTAVLRFVLYYRLLRLNDAASLMKTIDVRTVADRDPYDQVQFFLARGALESLCSADGLAEKNYREAIRRSRRPDDEIEAKLTLAGLLLSHSKTADEETLKLFEQAGLLLPQAKSPATLSYYLRRQAGLLEKNGLQEATAALCFAALDKSETAHLPLVTSACYQSLAREFQRRGDTGQAEEFLRKANHICIAEGEWQQSLNRLAGLSYLNYGSDANRDFYKNELIYALDSAPPAIYRLQLYALLSRMGGPDSKMWATKGLKESEPYPDEHVALLRALASELEGKVATDKVLDLYRQAARIAQPKAYRKNYGLDSSLGTVRYDMAEVLLREHRYAEAQDMLDKAALAEQQPGRRWYLCRALNRATGTALQLGDLDSARKYFRRVVNEIRSSEDEGEQSVLAAGLLYIHTYSALLEALESDPSSILPGVSPLAAKLLRSELDDESTYRLFLQVFDSEIQREQQASNPVREANAREYKGMLYEATDRREEARRAYLSALRIGTGMSQSNKQILYLALARLAYKDGGWEAARKELLQALPAVQKLSDGDYYYLALGSAELALASYPEAIERFRQVQSERLKAPALYEIARAQIGQRNYRNALESIATALKQKDGLSLSLRGRLLMARGEAQRLSGLLGESRQDYLQAIQALETTRQWASLLESYLGLGEALRALGRAPEAEEVNRKAKVLLEKVRDELDPDRLSASVLGQPASPAYQKAQIGRTVATDRSGFLLLQERLKREHPQRTKLNSPYSPSELLSLRETMPDDSALILIQSFAGETYVSALTRTDLITREIGVGTTDLLSQEEALNLALLRPGDDTSEKQSRLYQLLMQPVEGILQGKTRWRFLPTQEAQNLPFGTLTSGHGATLSQERILSLLPYSPSNQSPERLKPLTRPGTWKNPSILLLGAPTGQDLAGVKKELLRLGAQFPKSALLMGAEATTASFLREIQSHSIVHIASHATPEGIALSDKDLNLKEIFEARLSPGTLVVLSACDTARSQHHASSLAEAFQVAGASAVIASLWKVDDQATAELFGHFYSGLRSGRPPDQALALAQRAMQQSQQWKSPFYWGAFVITEAVPQE